MIDVSITFRPTAILNEMPLSTINDQILKTDPDTWNTALMYKLYSYTV